MSDLHDAVINNDFQAVAQLLEQGADADERDNDGWTPLHRAVLKNASDIVALLLKHGADVNAKGSSMGVMPMHVAASQNVPEVAILLLQNGADINARSDIDVTPLHNAAGRNASEMAVLLLKHGADVNARGEKLFGGGTPLHTAAWNDALDVAVILLQHGANADMKDNDDLTPLDIATNEGHSDIKQLIRKSNLDVDEANKHNNPSPNNTEPYKVTIVIERDDVLALDVSQVRDILDSFIPDLVKRSRNDVTIVINGYDEDSRELVIIPEVRAWFHQLFKVVPEVFFWMDMSGLYLTFYAIMKGTPVRADGGTTVSADDIQKFLMWGFENLNIFCKTHNFDPDPSNAHVFRAIEENFGK